MICDIGINGESSFEQGLLQRAPGCEVWGYDFSVTGVRVPRPFLLLCGRPDLTSLDQWGPEIMDDSELSHRAHFEPWALGGTDMHGENDNPKWWTLDSLMELNGACPHPYESTVPYLFSSQS
jgi:hypothetical protein